jgi:hypothetical protein
MLKMRQCLGWGSPTGNVLRSACAVLLLAALSACGGGGGGGVDANSTPNSSGSGSSGSSTTGPSVTADTTQFSSTVAPTDAAPNYQVHLNLNDPSGTPVYYTYSYDRTTIQSINLGLPNATISGTQPFVLSFALWPPALLGSGTFQSHISLQFCLDQQCTTPIAGAPVGISITYTVTGNIVSNATFQITPTASLSVEASDTAASATATISVYTNQLPPYTTYLEGRSQQNGVVANGSWQVTEIGGGANGTLTVNLKDPNVLGPGVYSDVITISVCYDQACTKQAAGSPWTLPVNYTVTATEGVDYQAQMLAATASDIAWSATENRLYAVTTSNSSLSPSSLLEIDPSTATVTRSLSLGGSPSVLSVSDDGLYAYVGFSDQGVVKRIALSSFTTDITINLPTDPNYGNTYAGYLLAMPGASHTMAVSLYAEAQGLTDWDSRGTWLYDDVTARPDTFVQPDAVTRVMGLSWGSNSSTLYAYDGNQTRLFTTSASSTGLSLANTATGVSISGNMYYLNSLLYGDDGTVTTPSDGTHVARFFDPLTVLEPVAAVDGTSGLAYFFYEELLSPVPLWMFATYDLQTQAVHAKARVNGCSLIAGGVNGKVGRLVRWGSTGLAVNCNEGLKIISGNFVTH